MIFQTFYEIGDGSLALLKNAINNNLHVLHAPVTSVPDIHGYPVFDGRTGKMEMQGGLIDADKAVLIVVDLQDTLPEQRKAILELVKAYHERGTLVFLLSKSTPDNARENVERQVLSDLARLQTFLDETE